MHETSKKINEHYQNKLLSRILNQNREIKLDRHIIMNLAQILYKLGNYLDRLKIDREK